MGGWVPSAKGVSITPRKGLLLLLLRLRVGAVAGCMHDAAHCRYRPSAGGAMGCEGERGGEGVRGREGVRGVGAREREGGGEGGKG